MHWLRWIKWRYLGQRRHGSVFAGLPFKPNYLWWDGTLDQVFEQFPGPDQGYNVKACWIAPRLAVVEVEADVMAGFRVPEFNFGGG